MGHRVSVSPFIFLIFFISIFVLLLSFDHQPLVKPNVLGISSTVQVGLMGDLGLGRTMTSVSRKKNNFDWIFSGVSQVIQKNDINFANLESPIVSKCSQPDPYTMVFCGDSRFVPSLKNNKFILGLANNHIFNYGQSGFKETTDFLFQNQVPHIYSTFSNPEINIQHINDLSLGFLSFDLTDSSNYKNRSQLPELIKKYNSQVDWLIVGLHWGREYQPKADLWQEKLAHDLVDAGADIIAGSHPHVFQNYEVYEEKPIYYSLGNFIFDQNWSRPTSNSNIVTLTLTKEKVIKFDLTPIVIKYNSRPEIK